MREILFRGKHMLVGPTEFIWVYGSLVTHPSGSATIHTEDGRKLPVHPETIGQYTGLQDKNGVKIFEGDIAISDSYYGKVAGKIKYRLGTFYLSCPKYSDEYLFNCDEAEVIGNIYDNPELLEVTP